MITFQPSRDAWEGFASGQTHAPWLQSWGWGEFQGRVGRRPVRCVIEDNGKIQAAAQAVVHRYAGGFTSLYIPHGPVFASTELAQNSGVWQELVSGIQKIAQQVGVVFVRFEPTQPTAIAKALSVRPVTSVQPAVTHVVDLSKDEAGLLAAMHQKTRYNIRVAERDGVSVERGGAEFLENFARLSAETETREKVHFFSPDYFRQMFTTSELAGHISLYRARLNNATLAAIIVLSYGDTAVYVHGGSTRQGREHMAPYLLQWKAIRDAKATGQHWYDFRGVAPATASASHPWAGFSRFKRGFGGVDLTYPGAYDWVRRPLWYQLYRLAQRVR